MGGSWARTLRDPNTTWFLDEKPPCDRFEGTLKKNGRYLCLTTRHCCIKDAYLFESPTTNLDELIRSYPIPGRKINKSKFPYEYVRHLGQLAETEFPPRKAFRSVLAKKVITQRVYRKCKKTYDDSPSMHSLLDWLIDYNNRDTIPFAYALGCKARMFYRMVKDTGIKRRQASLYQDHMGLPGSALRLALLHKRDDIKFYPPPESIHATLEKTILGGVSVISHRYRFNIFTILIVLFHGSGLLIENDTISLYLVVNKRLFIYIIFIYL